MILDENREPVMRAPRSWSALITAVDDDLARLRIRMGMVLNEKPEHAAQMALAMAQIQRAHVTLARAVQILNGKSPL